MVLELLLIVNHHLRFFNSTQFPIALHAARATSCRRPLFQGVPGDDKSSPWRGV